MNVTELLLGGSAWWVLPSSLLVLGATFGLMPGLLLRVIVLFYPKGHPRRDELFGELYDPEMGRVERFEWVFQQLETASRQGLALRKRERRQRRLKHGEDDFGDRRPQDPAGSSTSANEDRSDSPGKVVTGTLKAELPALTASVRGQVYTETQWQEQVLRDSARYQSELFPGNRSFRLDSPCVTSENPNYSSENPNLRSD